MLRSSRDFLNFSTFSQNSTEPNLEDSELQIIKEGILRKQGGKIKSWNSRWFVLRKDGLHYYNKEGGKYLVSF